MVNHSRRFHDTYRQLRNLIQKNYFGVPVRMDIFYYGGLKHNGVHVIDTLHYLFNDKLKLCVIGDGILTQYKRDPSFEATFVLKKSGAKVHLHPFDEKNYQVFDFDLKFDKARLKIENFESKFIFEKKVVNAFGENVLINAKLDWATTKTSCMENAMKLILKYLKTRDLSCLKQYTLDDAKDTMQALMEVEK